MMVRGIQFACTATCHMSDAPAIQVRVELIRWPCLAQVCPSQNGARPPPPFADFLIFLRSGHTTGLSRGYQPYLWLLWPTWKVFTISQQQSITDTLWRAVDFHRSGRRGLAQKAAFIRRGFAEGKFSNYYPYILDPSIFDGQRATLRPGVIGDLEKAWEVSSSSAEEREEDPEKQEPVEVAPKATWLSSSGPKEPPYPPPPSRLRPAEPSHPPPKKVKLVPKEPSGPPPGRSHLEGSSSSSATVARAKPAEPTPLGVWSVSIGATVDLTVDTTTTEVAGSTTSKAPSGVKQPPPFLANGSAYRATILGSQQAKPKAVTFSKPVEIKQQPLRPRVLLPDTCAYYTWVNGRLTETSTRDCQGAVAIRPELRVSQKLVLALDYHQVLDRSRTETAWAVQRVPRENFELIRKLKADLGDRLIICL